MADTSLAILIPAYNEERVIGSVVTAIPRMVAGVDRIETVIVNDGSKDRTAAKAATAGAIVISHRINRGYGVAITSCLAAAKALNVTVGVTMDADGQHDPNDLPTLIEPILMDKADVVVGTRMSNPTGMPLIRILGNRAMNAILKFFWRIKTTDSQSGYRAYGRKALETIRLQATGFEVSTEMFYAAKQANLRVVEVPIRSIYTDYSKAKGQNPITAVLTFVRFLARVLIG